jgi:hypothetical protein
MFDSSSLNSDDEASGSHTSNIHVSELINLDDLKEEISKLKSQLDEEKSNSKKAAEYGLSLLEDYKKTQTRNYELEVEIETCKSELESAQMVNFRF